MASRRAQAGRDRDRNRIRMNVKLQRRCPACGKFTAVRERDYQRQ